jgi:dCTP diphosphatase
MGFDLDEVASQIQRFSDDRDWEQFHTLKNLTMAISSEVGELAEITQWMIDAEVTTLPATPAGRLRVEEEVADIAIYLLRICQLAGINLTVAIERKIALNELNYPLESSKGSSAKYTELNK